MKFWVNGLLIASLIAAFSCENQSASKQSAAAAKAEQTLNSPAVNVINVTEAQQKIELNPDAVVIDVRTKAEYDSETGHVINSHLMPVQEIEQWSTEITEWKDKEVILICRSGNRSGIAGDYLRAQGFTKLYNVAGGMNSWNKEQLPVAKTGQ